MFYTIEKIDDHPCYKMQEILEVFFVQAAQGQAWTLANQHNTVSDIHGGSNFRSLLQNLHNEIIRQDASISQNINQQFINNNDIDNLCKGTLAIQNNILWDEGIGKKIKDFFLSCYPEKLDLGIFKRAECTERPTKRFYQDFIALNGNVCPFCSILPHKHPFGQKRGDFDHYIDIAHYPMAALNLDNLIPMCSECNQDYKHTANILENDDGTRRIFLYPYSLDDTFHLEIENIMPTAGSWTFHINIITDVDLEIVNSFDSVFKIKERIKRELHKRYDSWLCEESKSYTTTTSGDITIPGFKAFLLNKAEHVIDLKNRTEENKLLEHALFIYLANTDNEEINDIFLGSYVLFA